MKFLINFYLFALFYNFSEGILSKSDRNKRKSNEEVLLSKKEKNSVSKNLGENLKDLEETNFVNFYF